MEDERAKASLESTRTEHRELMRVVSEVEECLDGPPDREGRWIGRLAGKLPTLAGSLRAHFAEERGGALYQDIPLKHPRFSRQLERLAAEHGRILETVEALIRAAETLRLAEIHELREYNARLQLLIANIRRHEAEENELIVSALWDEVGTGD
jgi:hypothetical protein